MAAVHHVHAHGVGAVRSTSEKQIVRLILISERGCVAGIGNLTVDEARGLSVRLAEAIAKATAPSLAS